MCGITGFTTNSVLFDRNSVIRNMTDALHHRGPDDEGFFIDDNVSLGHRRLSIIDLPTGAQPISNEEDTLRIIYNGEVYNYLEIRKELVAQGHKFKTNSDTEVVLHAYEEFGPSFLNRLNGMFAFAIWDKREKSFFIARDRFGQKPLYYSVQHDDICFSSELKSLILHPAIDTAIDRQSLLEYLSYEYVPAPHTIYQDVLKIPAGHYLFFKEGKASVAKYWDYDISQTHDHSFAKAKDKVLELLNSSVKRRLMSDVPLGILLSGGIDSSLVAALAVKNADAQVKTFSIGFENRSFDESDHARAVANYLGTDHYEHIFSANDLYDAIDTTLSSLDEPFADASLLPTALLSKFTRQHVTVALGGDGGDELFCGYPTFRAEQYADLYRYVPNLLHRYLICPLANSLPVSFNNISFDFKIKQFLKGAKKNLPDRHHSWLGSFSRAEIESLLGGADLAKLYLTSEEYFKAQTKDKMNLLSYFYLKTYLQDDILFKADRASMLSSLEVRAPFLDVEFADFISTLPGCFKQRGATSKYILKEAAKGIIPDSIIQRPKKGFGIPVGHFFRSELKDRITDDSFYRTLSDCDIITGTVKALVSEHLLGKKDNRKQLWTLFVLAEWMKSH